MSLAIFVELVKGTEGHSRKENLLRVLFELTRTIPVAYAVDDGLCWLYRRHVTRPR